MERVVYNKLVRDAIQEKIERRGDTCQIRELTDTAEFIAALKHKVVEEAAELLTTTDRSTFLKEYADLMIVLDTLTKELEIAPAEIAVALQENLSEKGGFTKRHFLEWAESPTTKS